jgi:hypothetical protein
MAITSASTIIKLAGEGKTEEVMQALESAKEILVRRALRIAKRKQEIGAVVELKKILVKVAGSASVTVSVKEDIALVYKIETIPAVDVGYFDAICDIARAKRGKLIKATTYASYYGFTDKKQGIKFAEDAIAKIDKIAQCKGIKITLDKDNVGKELAESSPAGKDPVSAVRSKK